MPEDSKQNRESQLIGASLVLVGLVALAAGCHFHWAELNTTASGVVGGGLMMLKSLAGSAKNTAAVEPS